MNRERSTQTHRSAGIGRTRESSKLHLLLTAFVVALSVLAGCTTADSVSPRNLRVVLRSDRAAYSRTDWFSGTLTFINRTPQRIRAAFPNGGQSAAAVYDAKGVLRAGYSSPECAISYLELEPFGSKTDTLRFPFCHERDTFAPGTCRVRGWADFHEDIYSEIAVEVR